MKTDEIREENVFTGVGSLKIHAHASSTSCFRKKNYDSVTSDKPKAHKSPQLNNRFNHCFLLKHLRVEPLQAGFFPVKTGLGYA